MYIILYLQNITYKTVDDDVVASVWEAAQVHRESGWSWPRRRGNVASRDKGNLLYFLPLVHTHTHTTWRISRAAVAVPSPLGLRYLHNNTSRYVLLSFKLSSSLLLWLLVYRYHYIRIVAWVYGFYRTCVIAARAFYSVRSPRIVFPRHVVSSHVIKYYVRASVHPAVKSNSIKKRKNTLIIIVYIK